MVKILLLSLLLFIPGFCFPQSSDSLASIIRIDKLLSESQVLIDSQNMDLAFKKLSLAKSVCLKSSEIKLSRYGKISFNLGSYYEELGDYQNAEKWYNEAIEWYEKKDEHTNLEYANVLNSLAGIYTDLGHFEKAKYLYETTIAIRAFKLGKEHPDYARALNNLAGIYHNFGAYDSAIILFKEVQGIFFKSLGSDNLQYAQVSHNLANVYLEIGNFDQAEILYRDALSIREKVNGREDPLCAASLNCLGNLYISMGNYEPGLKYYQEALQIYFNTEGEKSLNTAGCMTNIARIFYEIGQFETAETNYLKALEVYKNTIGKESPDYAMCIDNLANMYATKKDYAKAEQLYLEALKIRETVFGQNHSEYGISLNNLGTYYSIQNDSNKAQYYLQKSQTLWEHIFGKEHPDYLLALNNLIRHYLLTDNKTELESKLIESVQIERNLVYRASRHLSEKELSKYISSFSSSLDRLFSFNNSSMKLNSICYNSLLFYKAYLLNVNAQLSNLVHRDSMKLLLFNKIKLLHQKLSKELSLPTADRSIENIKLLEEEINNKEKELQRKVLGSGDLHKDVVYQDILNNLKPNEAAIEFVHYNFVHPIPSGKINYAALILKPGLLEPIFIQLCDQKALDSLLHSSLERRADYVNSLYTISERGVKSSVQRGRNLSELIWKPLEQHLNGIKTIYYSSSGLLHRINLDAIPINEMATLSDSFQLIALGSTRQLLLPAKTNFKNNTAILFGGINFDQAIQVEPEHKQKSELKSNIVNGWEFLSGTEREVDALEKILQNSQFTTSKLKGFNASEDAIKLIGLKQNESPRILHFATHGYFFAIDGEKGTDAGDLSDRKNEIVFKNAEHPMLRSGLILAGGNAAWQGNSTPDGKEDGILTAYEISQMNLSNTELVVLSACETGLGDIQGNEGVYGLQRAFKIAGVKYLIMSLWQVPDKQTSLLMTTFYKNWLENKMSIPDAFHAAQKELRDLGLDPYQWAGFVLVE